ncbi:MAG: hypothetical protein BMS9Abin29_1305 [Gemmatimonadota bacterium]|nr:MAG: hypothetical protein BMS9Abin29_1305 [Gemmatimonadota bacterium]
MSGTASPSSRRWTLALAFLATLLSACTKWDYPNVPFEHVMRDPPDRLRLTVARTGEIMLREPYLDGDTVRGLGPGRNSGPIRVAVEDIISVRVEKTDVGRTFLLAGATALILGGIIADAVEDDPPPRPRPRRTTASCPLLYSWDGEGWRLDSSTFGGAIMPALARTDIDNLDHAMDEGGRVRLRLANEMDETDHVDAVQLLAVDHDIDVSVAPAPDGTLITVGPLAIPRRATDLDGHDAMARVENLDGWSWESPLRVRNAAAGSSELRDGLELEFDRPGAARSAKLVVDASVTPWAAMLMTSYVAAHGRETGAWYARMDADTALARGFGESLARQAFLEIEVRTDRGWVPQGRVAEASSDLSKRQVIRLDLSGVTGESVQVRVTAPPSLWRVDHVAIDYSADGAFDVREVRLTSALDRDGADMGDLLRAIDGDHLTLETGDLYELEFEVPPIPSGRARTYLARTRGWYRMHTSEEGDPDREFLRRVAVEPDAMARIDVERLNLAIEALQKDGGP